MPKGKAKSRFNYEINPVTGVAFGCKFEENGWCNLPKFKRCCDCLYSNKSTDKGCYVKL